MTDVFFEWMKNHIKTAFLAVAACSGVFGTLGGGTVTYYFANQQSREDRFANSLMEEYKAVADSKRALYASVDKFTFALGSGKKPDAKLVTELSDRLLDLHQRIDIFSLGLSDEDRQKISDVQFALAGLKTEAAKTKTKGDLEFFTGSLAVFESAYQAARPIVERKIGTPNLIFAS